MPAEPPPRLSSLTSLRVAASSTASLVRRGQSEAVLSERPDPLRQWCSECCLRRRSSKCRRVCHRPTRLLHGGPGRRERAPRPVSSQDQQWRACCHFFQAPAVWVKVTAPKLASPRRASCPGSP